jgi:hypothetical protein
MWRAAPETLQISEAVKKGKNGWVTETTSKQTKTEKVKNRQAEK